MDFNFNDALKAKESRSALTPGIKDATFVSFEYGTHTSQDSGDSKDVCILKLNIDGYGDYQQMFFKPLNAERKQGTWGLQASDMDHFKIILREIMEAIDPQLLTDIDEGKKTLSGSFKKIVDTVSAWLKDKSGTKTQIKLVPNSKNYVGIPSYPARINRNGDLGIATRIIGKDLVLTTAEQKKVDAYTTATPTDMKNNSAILEAMKDDLDSSDLPF